MTGIFSEFGVQVATYTYDPWGRPTSEAMTALGHYNPLRSTEAMSTTRRRDSIMYPAVITILRSVGG